MRQAWVVVAVFFSCLGIVSPIVGSAHAAPIMVKAGGRPASATYTLQASTDQSAPIYLYYVSRGNETHLLNVTLEAPSGATAVVDVAPLRGSAESVASSMQNSYRMQFQHSLHISANSASMSPMGGCTPEQLEQYRQLILNTPELSGLTPEELCARTNGGGSGGGNPPPYANGNSDSGVGVLRKDSCKGSGSRYLVRMAVNISAVSAGDLQSGAVVKATFQEGLVRGKKPATIKPYGDGMFGSNALLLMRSISPRSEALTMSKWNSAGQLQSVSQVKIENYVSYRGFLLTRSIATKLLTGRGSATFELMNSESAYSVCFGLQRVRQVRNGYPG